MDFSEFRPLQKLAKIMIAEGLSVAVAESCTAGLMQNALSQAKDSMSFFQGGLTVYNIGQKAKHLNVNPIEAESCNAVSKSVAEKIAKEVAQMFNSEVGVSITGYARAIPEEAINSCYAYLAFYFAKEKKLVSKRISGDSSLSQEANQEMFTRKMIEYLFAEVNNERIK